MRPSLARLLEDRTVGCEAVLHDLATAILFGNKDACILQIKKELAEKAARKAGLRD